MTDGTDNSTGASSKFAGVDSDWPQALTVVSKGEGGWIPAGAGRWCRRGLVGMPPCGSRPTAFPSYGGGPWVGMSYQQSVINLAEPFLPHVPPAPRLGLGALALAPWPWPRVGRALALS